MNAHILITDEETHDTVVNNSFWALKFSDLQPKDINDIIISQFNNTRKPYYAMLCDFYSLRDGDLVFLYKRQSGFYGIYKVKGEPFFDNSTIGKIDKSFPIRIEIECINYFEKPVPEELLFSTKEYESKFWSWFYRKIQGARGINTITPEATEALIELLVKMNGNSIKIPNIIKKYIKIPNIIKKYKRKKNCNITLPLRRKESDSVFIEDALRYYIIRYIGIKNFSEKIFGKKEDIEWYSNNVPYHVSGKNIDILVYHKNMRYTGYPLRYQFSVVELKRDIAGEEAISQVINYSKWVSTRLANGEIETVQPIVIAKKFGDNAISKAKMIEFNSRKIKLYKYKFTNNDVYNLEFEEVHYD
ncbi:MAG: hypothetical protein KatS3mg027_1321 [Bacteroidia bacterium]|nr:MAG: hypothetical protein KatS3mg027_1321 [Bacteroidia bacterium]